jgi:hypothetical protein
VATGVVHEAMCVGVKGSACVIKPSHNPEAEQEVTEESMERVSRKGKV